MDASTYHAFSQLLKKSGSDLSPAEVQGTFMGLLSGQPSMEDSTVLHTVIESLGIEKKPSAELSRVLNSSLEIVQNALESNSTLEEAVFEFPLYIPSGDSAATQAQALASWCKGFLYGLGLSGANLDGCAADAKEALRDITQIAALPPMDEENSDEEEMHYVESIHDYLQVAALLIAADLKK